MGYVAAVCTSLGKRMHRKNAGIGRLAAELGLESDAHAGSWHRRVGLSALEMVLNGGQIRVGDEVRVIGE
ncbi:hypothetical protein [Desulfoscipio gibsoniae]